MAVRIQVDDTALRAAFARLAAVGEDPTRALRAIGQHLVTETGLRFEGEKGPGGVPWKKSGRAEATGGQTLSDSGRLKASVTYQVNGKELLVGTNVRYARIHQFGGVIRAKSAKGLRFRLPWARGEGDSGWRRVQQVTLPARPFLGVDAGDREEIAAILAEQIRRAAGEATA